jgi:hypothetical protein
LIKKIVYVIGSCSVSLAHILFISQLIESLQPFSYYWNVFISEGLFIGAWVSLWHPIELLLFERWYERYDKHVYQHIVKNINVVIKEW